MLFSCSTTNPPSLHRLFSFHCHHFFLSFLPSSSEKMSLPPSYGIMLFENKTHTCRQTRTCTDKHGHARAHTNGLGGREWTFDSSEMVDLLMAVTVQRHGWFTWTQPHLSLSHLFLPLYAGRCSQVHINPQTTFRQGVRQKETHRKR